MGCITIDSLFQNARTVVTLPKEGEKEGKERVQTPNTSLLSGSC